MLMRIFSPCRKLALFIRGLTAFLICYYIATLMVRIFVCRRISAYWNLDGNCINEDVLFTVDVVNLITDATILVLPIILAWSLRLPRTKKIKVAVVLGAGGLAVISNIYRLYALLKGLGTPDISHYIMIQVYCGYVKCLSSQ
jgi:hypothetical protein